MDEDIGLIASQSNMSAKSADHRSITGAATAGLVVVEGIDSGVTHLLFPARVTTLGRSPLSDVVLKDELCSREQCEVFQSRQTWYVRDRGSRNGTFVDGQRISGDLALEEGQLIQAGNTRLQFTQKRQLLSSRESQQQDTEIGIKTHRIVGDLGDSRILEALDDSRYRPDRLTRDPGAREATGRAPHRAVSYGDRVRDCPRCR